MDDKIKAFIEANRTAVMTTVKKDGMPHVAMVGVGFVGGELWSSGTQDRVRTAHVRRDPRATLLVLNLENRFEWVALETTVDILEGPEAVEANLALYRSVAGEPDDLDEYRAAMVAEKRLIYRFTVQRTYGMV